MGNENRRNNQMRYEEEQRRRRAPQKRRPKKKKKSPVGLFIVLLVLILGVAAVLIFTKKTPEKEAEVQLPTLPEPEVVSTATIGTTGDILIHSPILSSADEGGYYNFEKSFALAAPYYSAVDLMVANLEVTCGGSDAGSYTGYPTFNCPDEIVSALKNAGVDICLTANNHAYDTGFSGMMRTLEVVAGNGLGYLGTRMSEVEKYIITKEINGIRVGMINFTYDTRNYADDQKSLNGITMADEAQNLVNSFCYNDLETMYAQAQEAYNRMEQVQVDAKIIYMHWGNEYWDDPNDVQVEIAYRLAEIGYDVIIGGHPHVIERYEEITNSKGHTTCCIYSTGNELSNQRASIMTEDSCRGYTEDGMIFQFTLSKFNNGKVKLTGVRIIPTWVDLTYDDSGRLYSIVVLDDTVDAESWGASDTSAALSSYERTVGRVGGSLIW